MVYHFLNSLTRRAHSYYHSLRIWMTTVVKETVVTAGELTLEEGGSFVGRVDADFDLPEAIA